MHCRLIICVVVCTVTTVNAIKCYDDAMNVVDCDNRYGFTTPNWTNIRSPDTDFACEKRYTKNPVGRPLHVAVSICPVFYCR